MKEVLWFFYPDEGRWSGVVKKHQILEHLDGAIRCKSGQNGVRKRRIFDLQKQSPIWHHFRQHSVDTRNPTPQDLKDVIESLTVLLGEILNYIREVITRFCESLLRASFRLAPPVIGRQV
jgi:hypothetical protein